MLDNIIGVDSKWLLSVGHLRMLSYLTILHPGSVARSCICSYTLDQGSLLYSLRLLSMTLAIPTDF